MYDDDDADNTLDERLLIIYKNKKKWLIVRMEVGEEVNISKTTYIVVSWYQDTGRNQHIKINNIFY